MFGETGIRPAFIKQACGIPPTSCYATTIDELRKILFVSEHEIRDETEEEFELFLVAREMFKQKSAELLESLVDPSELYSLYEMATRISLPKALRTEILSKYIQYESDIKKLKSWTTSIEKFPEIVPLFEKQLLTLYENFTKGDISLKEVRVAFHEAPFIDSIRTLLRRIFFGLFQDMINKVEDLEGILEIDEKDIEKEAVGHNLYERDKMLSAFHRITKERLEKICERDLKKAVSFDALIPVWYASGTLGGEIEKRVDQKLISLWAAKLKRTRSLDGIIKLSERTDIVWDVTDTMAYQRWGEIFAVHSKKASTKEEMLLLCEKMPVYEYHTPSDPSETLYDWEEYKLAFVRKLASFYNIPS